MVSSVSTLSDNSPQLQPINTVHETIDPGISDNNGNGNTNTNTNTNINANINANATCAELCQELAITSTEIMRIRSEYWESCIVPNILNMSRYAHEIADACLSMCRESEQQHMRYNFKTTITSGSITILTIVSQALQYILREALGYCEAVCGSYQSNIDYVLIVGVCFDLLITILSISIQYFAVQQKRHHAVRRRRQNLFTASTKLRKFAISLAASHIQFDETASIQQMSDFLRRVHHRYDKLSRPCIAQLAEETMLA